MTQTQMLKEYLETHYSITPKQAMDELGIYRLGARIYDLKKAGVKIKSSLIEVPTRHGETTRVKMYWIPGEPKEALK